MRFVLKINGVDVSRWLAEGVEQDTVYRNSRQVVTRDGRLHQVSRPKRKISAPLLTLSDSVVTQLSGVIYGGRIPVSYTTATVQYLDKDTGALRTATFYAAINKASAKKVEGGATFYSGLSIELEEV